MISTHQPRIVVSLLLLLSLFSAACGPGDGNTPPGTAPTVSSNAPLDGAIDVALNAPISVTLSADMDAETLTPATFTVSSGNPLTEIAGTVTYGNRMASFWPSSHLEMDTPYTARLSTGAQSAEGIALEADHVWEFTTGVETDPGLPVNLGTAGNYVLLAKSGISTVPTSAITGDVAVSPAAASYITGFSMTADSTNTFSTSDQVTGQLFAADYASPTPSNLTTAVSDMELAFTNASARAPDETELGAGDIGGMTLDAGVYKWGTGLLIPTSVTLNGSATDVWVMQVAGDLTVSSAVEVLLTGGALPKNIFWQVSGQVELGTTSHFEGIILSQTSVTMATDASLNGRVLAQTAIDLDRNVIVEPAD